MSEASAGSSQKQAPVGVGCVLGRQWHTHLLYLLHTPAVPVARTCCTCCRFSWYKHPRRGTIGPEKDSFNDLFCLQPERSNSVRFKLDKDTSKKRPTSSAALETTTMDLDEEQEDSEIHFLTPKTKQDSFHKKQLGAIAAGGSVDDGGDGGGGSLTTATSAVTSCAGRRRQSIKNSLSSPDYALLPSIVVDSCGMTTPLRHRCEVCHHDNAVCCSNSMRLNSGQSALL